MAQTPTQTILVSRVCLLSLLIVNRCLGDLAARSASVDDDDFDFQRDCVAALTGFNTNMDGFRTALVDTASSASGTSDKGLANYDRTNDLETLLKNLANLTKNVLSSIDALVYNLPVVGPILGPSMSFSMTQWNGTHHLNSRLRPQVLDRPDLKSVGRLQ